MSSKGQEIRASSDILRPKGAGRSKWEQHLFMHLAPHQPPISPTVSPRTPRMSHRQQQPDTTHSGDPYFCCSIRCHVEESPVESHAILDIGATVETALQMALPREVSQFGAYAFVVRLQHYRHLSLSELRPGSPLKRLCSARFFRTAACGAACR